MNEAHSQEATVEHTGDAQHANSGMPQLNVASYPSQLFWLAITFVALYVLLSRLALPKVGRVLEARQARIDADLSTAARMKDEAAAAREAYEKSLTEARGKAQSMLSEMQGTLAKSAHQHQTELDARHAKDFAEAETRIRASRDKALSALTPVAAELTGLIVEKLGSIRPSEAELTRAVAQSGKGA